MRLKASFEDFLTNRVSLDETRLQRVQTAHAAVRDAITSSPSVVERDGATYLQGSYALHTAVRPVHEDHAYDVDVVLAMQLGDGNGGLLDGEGVLDWILDVVRGIPQYADKAERRRRCIRVNYESDSQRFHLDVVPAHHVVSAGDLILVPPYWTRSNPRGFAAWLDSRVSEHCRRLRHVVRLLKFWRNIQFPDGSVGPNSMTLTALAGQLAPSDGMYESLDEALFGTMRGIGAMLDTVSETEQFVVSNPSLDGENLARDWSAADIAAFRTHLGSATRYAEAALMEKDEARSIELWNHDDLFAGFFPTTVRGLGEGLISSGRAMTAGTLTVGAHGRIGAPGLRVPDNRGYYGHHRRPEDRQQ